MAHVLTEFFAQNDTADAENFLVVTHEGERRALREMDAPDTGELEIVSIDIVDHDSAIVTAWVTPNMAAWLDEQGVLND